MDFMNLMNQINGAGCGNCGCNLNNGCGNNNNNCGFLGSGILPLLFLLGAGGNGNNFSGGNMMCYPNNQPVQQFITPTSIPSGYCCDSNLRYRTKKVRQAYMEVPVSTYQVAQPYLGMQSQMPMSMNIMPTCSGNRNGIDLFTILLLGCLFNRNNRSCCNCHNCQPSCNSCNNGVSSDL